MTTDVILVELHLNPTIECMHVERVWSDAMSPYQGVGAAVWVNWSTGTPAMTLPVDPI